MGVSSGSHMHVVLEVLTVVTIEIFVFCVFYKVMFKSLYKGSKLSVLFILFGLFVTPCSVVI